MVKTFKTSIGKLLDSLDKNDNTFYSGLSDEEKKQISPWVVMRYMSSCSKSFSELYLITVNEVVNVNFSTFNDHKDFQMMLLSSCGVGSAQKHEWIAPPKGKKAPQDALYDSFIDLFPDKTELEIDIMFKNSTRDDIIAFLDTNGVDVSKFRNKDSE